MKIIANDTVYVQNNDIVFLNHTDLPIPASIIIKVFGCGLTIVDDSNRYEFVKFDEESEIDFFRSLDWIIDYDLIKKLSEEQIIELIQNVTIQRNNIVKTFNAMNSEERRKNIHMVEECERLDFKINSLRDMLFFKKGQLNIILPEGINYPEGYKKVEENGFKRLLKKIRKNNGKKQR